MPKTLIVAEKPDAARTIAGAILGRPFTGMGPHRGQTADGVEITVVSARGHLYELAPPEFYDAKYAQWNPRDLPIVPKEKWRFTQSPRKDSGDYLRIIGQQVPSHAGEEIVNACDAGREGELIFRKVVRNAKPVKGTKFTRMWAHSMTVEGLSAAYTTRQPLANYDGLGMAGQTRDESDWLIGMNMTVLATKTLPRGQGAWRSWSIGRVQTPTLALVVERDLLIERFAAQPFWEVYGVFGGIEAKADLDAYANGADRAKLLGAPKVGTDRDKKAFWDLAKAQVFETSAKFAGEYDVTDRNSVRTEKPPLPLDLQEIQKIFSKRHGLTATATLEVIQKLYEEGYVSYPRTDSRYIPDDMKEVLYVSIAKVLAGLKVSHPSLSLNAQPIMPKAVATASRAFDTKKCPEHSGLVPTGKCDGLAGLGKDHLYAFMTILQFTLMALDEPAKYKVVQRRWSQRSGSGPYAPAIFQSKREELDYAGFTRWMKKDTKEKSAALPPKGAKQTIDSTVLKELKTNPPDHFTDATLLDAMKYAGESLGEDASEEEREAMQDVMKDKGLGTPATRAAMIDKLVLKGVIERHKTALISSINGRQLVRELTQLAPAFLSAKLTADWELKLKQMERNEATDTREQFLDALLASFIALKDTFIGGSKRLKDAEDQEPLHDPVPIGDAVCPISGKPLTDRGPFFETEGLPKARLWKKRFGREFTALEYVELLKAHKSGKPYHATNLVSQEGKPYAADLLVEKDTGKVVIFRPEPAKVKAKCPKSKKALLDHGGHFEAPGWSGLRLYKKSFGRDFSAEEYVTILEGWVAGSPLVVSGMISSKTQRAYSAKLIHDVAKNRVGLEFEQRAS